MHLSNVLFGVGINLPLPVAALVHRAQGRQNLATAVGQLCQH